MRINLLIDNPKDVRSGYVNIDPLAPANDPAGRVNGVLHDLSHTVDDGEAVEIIANEILEYHPGGVLDDVINNWLKKLAHGGTITLSTIDVREVARNIWLGTIDLDEANTLLYGEQKTQWQFKKCALSLSDIVGAVEEKGFKILQKRVSALRATVTIQRP